MTAYEIALNLFNNSDTMDDPEYRMAVGEAERLLREFRSCAEDDEKEEYEGIAAADVAEEYNNLVEEFLRLNAEEAGE